MRHRKARFSMFAVGALAAATLATGVGVGSAGGDPAANVTICHRTNSVTNPYVKITVDESAVDGDTTNDKGQGDHLAEHTGPVFDALNPPPPPHNGDQWGDIIPPFDENGNPRPNPSATLNWPGPNGVGAAIFFNDCNPVDFGSLVVTKVVAGDGATAGTLYSIHVACELSQGGVSAGSADLSLADGASSDPMTVVVGSTCTATEDTSGLNANFVSTSNDGPVTIAAGTQSTITVTNNFAVAPTPGSEVAPAAAVAPTVVAAPKTTG